MLQDDDGAPRAIERSTYERNPSCWCAWCRNGGVNPAPNAPAALGYDEPHIPPPGRRATHLSAAVPGRPGEIV